MRSFKHLGNHITINTIQELENARSQIKKFNLNEKNKFWKDKSIFITGVAGFVGSNLAKNLANEGANVIGLTRNQKIKFTIF